eukprot:2604797-Rhodomonas_salina.1
MDGTLLMLVSAGCASLLALLLYLSSALKSRYPIAVLCAILVARTWVSWDLDFDYPFVVGLPVGVCTALFMDTFIKD